ncbi:MAG: DUF4158 domain-containing protein [Solirubrobacteraceae bacterium]
MPGWPSAAERRELGAFPGQAGPEDVSAFFELSPGDLRFVLGHRGEARLGVAVQLCSLRWLGFVPEDLRELPQAGAAVVVRAAERPTRRISRSTAPASRPARITSSPHETARVTGLHPAAREGGGRAAPTLPPRDT